MIYNFWDVGEEETGEKKSSYELLALVLFPRRLAVNHSSIYAYFPPPFAAK